MSPGAVTWQHPQLLRRVGEEADAAVTGEPVLAWLGPVTRRVEPALKNTMSKLAGVAFGAAALAEVGAGRTRVVVLPRVAAAGLLARMSIWALGPVM